MWEKTKMQHETSNVKPTPARYELMGSTWEIASRTGLTRVDRRLEDDAGRTVQATGPSDVSAQYLHLGGQPCELCRRGTAHTVDAHVLTLDGALAGGKLGGGR